MNGERIYMQVETNNKSSNLNAPPYILFFDRKLTNERHFRSIVKNFKKIVKEFNNKSEIDVDDIRSG